MDDFIQKRLGIIVKYLHKVCITEKYYCLVGLNILFWNLILHTGINGLISERKMLRNNTYFSRKWKMKSSQE